jgi:hypothetical protein
MIVAALAVAWRAWRERRRIARSLHDLGFTGDLVHDVTVPPGPDGRPGERLHAPSRSSYHGVLAADGSRNDASFWLSRSGSQLTVVCYGREAEQGSPDQHLRSCVENLHRALEAELIDGPHDTVVAGEPARTCRFRFRTGSVLTDYRFSHQGWVFGCGVLHRRGDHTDVDDLARATLDTWEWIDADT